MLQQTQVSRVVERFETFMRRFPDVRTLAAADEQDVLAAWRGLGYYRRARNLHAAAKLIVAEFGGKVPADVAQLRRLPGVGRYTAGAIASIVFGVPAPVVDGNVQRVLARLYAKSFNGEASKAIAWSWRTAEDLVKRAAGAGGASGAGRARAGVFNEALMELGATVCTVKSPRCDVCPVASACRAARTGMQAKIPHPRQRPPRRVVHHYAVIIQRADGRILTQQRGSDGMWAAMWQVPTIESSRQLTPAAIAARLEVTGGALSKIGSFKHNTTHRQIQFHIYRATSRRRLGVWRAIHELDELPMSNAQRKAIAAFESQSSV